MGDDSIHHMLLLGDGVRLNAYPHVGSVMSLRATCPTAYPAPQGTGLCRAQLLFDPLELLLLRIQGLTKSITMPAGFYPRHFQHLHAAHKLDASCEIHSHTCIHRCMLMLEELSPSQPSLSG